MVGGSKEKQTNAEKGGRGSKIPEILRTSFMYGPFGEMSINCINSVPSRQPLHNMAIVNPRTRIFCVVERSLWLPGNLVEIPATGAVPLRSGKLRARSSSPPPHIRCLDTLAEIKIILEEMPSLNCSRKLLTTPVSRCALLILMYM